MNIRMSGIKEYSVENAIGISQTLFSSICRHNCYGCHNPESHDYKNGYDASIEELFSKVKNNRNKVVTFSGGDPMFQPKGFLELAMLIKDNTNKTIWCYTGFTWEELINGDNKDRKELLKYIDVLVDGKFEIGKKDLSLSFRGSSNQRLLLVQESLKQGKTIELQL